jgi:hypothetical protein
MDAAGEDIKSNPRLIFTQKHKDWRDIMEWLSPNSISRRFESLPYEVQYDIYVNDREAFEDLPDETKERFKAARPQYYPDGGPINPPNGKTSIAERNPKQYDFLPEPSRFDEGVKASGLKTQFIILRRQILQKGLKSMHRITIPKILKKSNMIGRKCLNIIFQMDAANG